MAKLHRFIGDFDFSKKPFRITDKEILNQVKNVLRFKAGDTFVLVDKNRNEAVATIKTLKKDSADLDIASVMKNEKEPEVEVALYCAVLKKENFELVIQKTTEAGAAIVIPVITKRTVKLSVRQDRLEKIAKEAAEQSGRGRVPSIGETMTLEEAMKQSENYDANLFFQPGAPLFMPERLHNSGAKSVSIFIGPEGGWDESEIEAARLHDLKVVGLGGLTLGAETAAIIAVWSAATAGRHPAAEQDHTDS